jgi:hypothetical protein
MRKNALDLLFAGRVQSAIKQLVREYKSEPDGSEAMSLGVAYLWIEDYHSAWVHFSHAQTEVRVPFDSLFSMAGVAKWCLNRPLAAVEEWSFGLRCPYTDGAGGVELPLTLYFASVVRPAVYSQSEAKQLLTKKANRGWIRNWPGPLAKYVAGQIDEKTLRVKCDNEPCGESTFCHWESDFHLAVVKRAQGNRGGFKKAMRQVAAVSATNYQTDQDLFLSKLWSPEFYLARFESRSSK